MGGAALIHALSPFLLRPLPSKALDLDGQSWVPHLHAGLQKFREISGAPDGKESACNMGDPALIPGSGRSPGEGNGNPL